MRILGISCFYHDSAACVIEDGAIIAAAQEERFTRIKHDSAFPSHAVRYCLAEAGGRDAEIEAVAFYDKPILKFHRILETYFSVAPMGLRVWGDPAKGDPMRAKIPLGRFGKPVEVADLILFLASPASDLICGETILIDGGYTVI